MTPEDIVSKFTDALEQFEPIDGQLSGTDLTWIREVLAQLLLQIRYNKTEGTHNLISLIWLVPAYTTWYGAEFAKPVRVGAYNKSIDDNATAVVRVYTEAVYMTKRADRVTYKTAGGTPSRIRGCKKSGTQRCSTPTLCQRRSSHTSKRGAPFTMNSIFWLCIMKCSAITLK